MKKLTKRSECPLSRSLDFFGDKWTLLIIRDIAFRGFRFYQEFLNSGEGIATNVLSDRLKMLETQGFLISKKYEKQKTKKVYRLTDAGIGLIPIIFEMLIWGSEFDPTLEIVPEMLERMKHDRDNLLKEIVDALQKTDREEFC